MLEFLDIPNDIVDNLAIELTRRIQQPRRSRISDEALVRFADPASRDVVQSYALNLANHRDAAGIRLEIPPHLTGTFRLYEEHAGALREKFPQGFKRSVKFDDVSMDLVMDIKLPQAKKWHRFNRQEVEKATRARKRTAQDNNDVSSSDTAERNSILLQPGSPASGASWKTADDYVEVEDTENEDNQDNE